MRQIPSEYEQCRGERSERRKGRAYNRGGKDKEKEKSAKRKRKEKRERLNVQGSSRQTIGRAARCGSSSFISVPLPYPHGSLVHPVPLQHEEKI